MRHVVTIVGLLLMGIQISAAQNQVRHTPPTVLEQDRQHELTFNVPGLRADQVQTALLFYRYDGDTAYEQTEVRLQQGAFRAPLPLPAGASSVQYYFKVQTQDGAVRTYPLQNATDTPVQVNVVDRVTGRDTSATNPMADQIAPSILSPAPEATATPDDAVLAVTFFYEDASVAEGQFRVYVDDREVTNQAEIDDHFLSYTPHRLGLGTHTARVTYQRNDQEYPLVEWGFTVSRSTGRPAAAAVSSSQDYVSGRAEFSSQSQSVGQSGSDIVRGRVHLEGREGIVRYDLDATLTSEQSSRLQPRNRYGAELLFGEWGELRVGDSYPTLSRMTLAGRRVRGVDTKLKLFGDNLNAQFLYGRLRRTIGNRYQNIQANIRQIGTAPDGSPIVDSTYALSFADQGRGTYQRNVIGGRLSVGDESPLQWGINALRVRDDTTSLTPIDNFTDVQRHSQDLAASLSNKEQRYLEDNPNALSVSGSNAKPKDNFMASSDLHLEFDDARIRFNAEAGASLLNENTRGGALTRERAEDLGIDLDQTTEDLLSQVSWLIIINEQMSTLPFRFEGGTGGDRSLEPFVPGGIFGGQSRLSLNYLGQQLRVRYRWFGPEYVSLANSTLRQDLKGLNVSDRFQLFNNQLYVTLGYETLENNVLGTKSATTTTETYRTNLSWYPVRRSLPRISINARIRDRGNGVPRTNPVVPAGEESAAVRNVQRVGSDSLQVLANPVQSLTTQLGGSITQRFELGSVINDATLNVSYLETDDTVFAYGGTTSLSYSLTLRNRYATLPLDTQLGVNVNRTESAGGLSSLDILGASVGGTAYFLDRDLRVSGTFALTFNTRTSRGITVNRGTPNEFFDDYYEPSGDLTEEETNNYVVNLGARYELADRHSVLANADLNNVVAQGPRTVPNDRILEVRYVFDF